MIAAKSPLDLVEHARLVAGFDAPDQTPHDAVRGDFGFEAAGLPIILAFDRIQGKPCDRCRATTHAGDGVAAAYGAAGRVIAAAEVDEI